MKQDLDLILFELELSIFRDFPTLDPLKLGEYPTSEVWYLINIRNKYSEEHKSDKQTNAQSFTNNKEERRRIDPRQATWLG